MSRRSSTGLFAVFSVIAVACFLAGLVTLALGHPQVSAILGIALLVVMALQVAVLLRG